MSFWPRLLLALIHIAIWPVMWLMPRIPPAAFVNVTQIDMNAQSHASALGVLAGIIAAIVAIFLTARPSDSAPDDGKHDLRAGAIGTLLCAFLHAILGSFLYASIAGYSGVWYGTSDHPSARVAMLPDFLFNCVGIEYFLTVYLCFFGLVLLVGYFTRHAGLAKFTAFMLAMTFLIGSAWIFIDFVAFRPLGTGTGNMAVIGAIYALPPALAWLLPNKRPGNIGVAALFWGLGLSLVLCLGVSIVSAYAAPMQNDAEAAQLVNTGTNVALWVLPIVMGVLFFLLTRCLSSSLTEFTSQDAKPMASPVAPVG